MNCTVLGIPKNVIFFYVLPSASPTTEPGVSPFKELRASTFHLGRANLLNCCLLIGPDLELICSNGTQDCCLWSCRGTRSGVWAAGVVESVKAKMESKTGDEGFTEKNFFLLHVVEKS